MTKSDFDIIETYMLSCMKNEDIAHDANHIYRVLNNALDLMKGHHVDEEVLIASCLLHDIGREMESKNPLIDHAEIGSEMAYDFLVSIGWQIGKANKVKECILNHRRRIDPSEAAIETKLTFDADKLELVGAIGIARNIAYNGRVSEPIYTSVNWDADNMNPVESAFMDHLKVDLDRFYTDGARQVAKERIVINKQFYCALQSEIINNHKSGEINIKKYLD